ncbi:MAG: hypothetical protein J0I10_22060 [Verrucomicrobia bacterium]|nr:hypothetical protein [Verrucomicrobiota bacterium]
MRAQFINSGDSPVEIAISVNGGSVSLLRVPPGAVLTLPAHSDVALVGSSAAISTDSVSIVSADLSGLHFVESDRAESIAFNSGLTLSVPVFAFVLGLWLLRKGFFGRGALGEE